MNLKISAYPSRQPNCFELPLRDRKDKELWLSSQTSYLDYCGWPPRLPESSGRLGVEKSEGFYRMEMMSANIPENLPEDGSNRDRSICL